MTEIRYAPEFKIRYQELPPSIQKKAERRERLFRSNPFHPALQTEKLNLNESPDLSLNSQKLKVVSWMLEAQTPEQMLRRFP